MKNIIMITGASSGLGRMFAERLDNRFKCIDEFWLIARSTERLEETANLLDTPCKIITADLSCDDATKNILKMLERECDEREEEICIKMLINCAGFGKYTEFAYMDEKEINDMIQVNIKSLTTLTKYMLPYMAHNSRIINIASAAAFVPQPLFAQYAATKSYVLSLSRALNAELEKYGIWVTAVCPGPVDTNFFSYAESGSSKKAWYKNLFMVKPQKVVDKAIHDSINRYHLSIYGLPMKLLYIATKFIPHRLILKFLK